MRSMLFHGRDESYLTIDDKPKDIWRRFHFPRHGYSDRMTELEAALGLGDLGNWQDMIKKRQNNASYLVWRLGSKYGIEFPFSWTVNSGYSNHAFMFFPAYVERRDELMVYLEKQGIQSRTMMPLISQPITKPYLKRKYPVAQYIGEHGILLPCHQYLKKQDLDYMLDTIKNFYR